MPQAQRTVTFSPMTKEVVLAPSAPPKSSKWYSREDIQAFQQTVLAETQRLRRLLASGNLPDEELVSCIGIEKYLSRGLCFRRLPKQDRHIELPSYLDKVQANAKYSYLPIFQRLFRAGNELGLIPLQ